MNELEFAKAWVENHESFLSGLAAAMFLATLVLAPLAASTRILRERRAARAQAGDGPEPETPQALTNDEVLERPAVAVLPFTNTDQDDDPEYFASGITEELITALASFRVFPVIGRSSVFADDAPGADACEIARGLSARYVVHGSVRRAEGRVRIHAHLADVESAHTLWSRRYDRALENVFALQDEIGQAIVAAIEPRLDRAEERRALAAREDELDAWDASLRALWHVRRGSREDLAAARELLEWAIVRDPMSSRAHSILALCHFHEALLGFHRHSEVALAGTLRAARAAVDLDDEDWVAHAMLGIATLWTLRDYDTALAEQDRALALNPSAALSHQFRACVLQFAGRPAEAIESLDLVLRLEPRYQSRAMVLADLSLCHLLLDDLERAAECARRALDEAPDHPRAHQRLVAALGLLGHEDLEEARRQLLALDPDATIESIAATYPFRDERDAERLVGGLRAAGLPTGGRASAARFAS